MGEWQPISTAPRDGREIILCWPDIRNWQKPNVGAGWWNQYYGHNHRGAWFLANLDNEYGEPIRPTHWQPLPPPPKEAKDG